jgi:molybdopterin molybdotransferase
VRRPRVTLIATGDELVPPGTTPGPGQIVSSNSLMLAALLGRAGAVVHDPGIVPDRRDALATALLAAPADLIVTIGGASVGDHDLVGPVLRARGMALDFWKIAMRPGKPLMFGRLDGKRIIGLPGNPVSALVCTRIFVVPLIAALLGRPPEADLRESVRVAAPLDANGPREHYMRATLRRGADGVPIVVPARSQDSSLLSPLADANAFIVRPPGAPAVPAGTLVDVVGLDF